MYQIGMRIKAIREERGIPQKDFAAAIQAKNTTVSNWEKGLSRPDVDMLAKICVFLKVSADELLGINVDPAKLTERERQVILLYREKPELCHAVDVLLGVENDAGKKNRKKPQAKE